MSSEELEEDEIQISSEIITFCSLSKLFQRLQQKVTSSIFSKWKHWANKGNSKDPNL